MEDPKDLKIEDFTYELPQERIAAHPLEERDLSKLLVYRAGALIESVYRNVADHLPENSTLIFNDTRVIPARLYFPKPSGSLIEIFLLEPESPEGYYQTAGSASARWKCLIGKAGKWKHGQVLELVKEDLKLKASITAKAEQHFVVEFQWTPEHMNFFEVITLAGHIPLPPYIKRKPEEADLNRYQTVYARQQGSVAAPTAGLHFTPAIFASLMQKGIGTDFLTLHVGAGTFLPVKSETMSGHHMHAEWIDIDRATVERLAQIDGHLFCVGTTSLRTLESLFWMGNKAISNPTAELNELAVKQWEVYETETSASRQEAFLSLGKWMKMKGLEKLTTTTEIMIAPPYRVRTVKGLITNFHQPGSTLLLLVAALVGEEWKRLYEYALQHDFRFLSYGDGCLLFVD